MSVADDGSCLSGAASAAPEVGDGRSGPEDRRRAPGPQDLAARVRPHATVALIGLIPVSLMLVWAAHDGGFDDDTWYWGALVLTAVLAAVVASGRRARGRISRPARYAVGLLGLYVAWSYLSMLWAQSPGIALNGSNRALLYLLMFTLIALLPWTVEAAVAALTVFAVGVGVIAVVLLVRLASADSVFALLSGGRMNAPTGYYNATAALFSMDALVCIGLAARRELPGLLRGLLVALAGAALQLAVTGQSRGWLFTLPVVVLIVAIVSRDRLRLAAAAVIPVLVTLIPVRGLLHIYDVAYSDQLNAVARHAGEESLVLFGVAFVVGTLVAWADSLIRPPGLSRRGQRALGTAAVGVVIAGVCAGGLVVSHGQPFQFIARQWRGFSHPQAQATGSHFADVGSGRYDFWRVSLDAFLAHPIGGLGQDNFGDYYLPRRHTNEEPAWTHSLELRLLTHTGIVGLLLFTAFLVFALAAALRARRRGPPLTAAVAAVCLYPLIMWIVYGSVDWFWEMPCLSGPAFGFLALSTALAPHRTTPPGKPAVTRRGFDSVRGRTRLPSAVAAGLGVVTLLAVVAVLAFPYLSVRETSIADDVQATNPAAALRHFATAASLNPLNPIPGRLAGTVALQRGQYRVASARFRQSIAREPGGWFAWLGAGLAASGLGQRNLAHRDFRVAYGINSVQPAIKAALDRIYGPHPLTPAEAFRLLVPQ